MRGTPSSHPRRQRVYLAGPLFNDAERAFNVMVAQRLGELVEVYLPQRDGGLVGEMVKDGVDTAVAVRRVFEGDIRAIDQADCLVAILDGRTVDEGVAFEIGVAFSQGKQCLGLQTDSRRLASWGNNPMLTGALTMVLSSVDDLVSWMGREAHARSRNLARQPILAP
jgi:nucleoside 2-deoxyribosyltransferase